MLTFTQKDLSINVYVSVVRVASFRENLVRANKKLLVFLT